MTARVNRIVYIFVAFSLICSAVTASFAQMQPNTSLPIVFVHGNGDDAAKWIGIMWLFESNNYPTDKLFSIRFTHPNSRSNDTVEEVNRSSTTDATAELSAFVTRVLIETHSSKVILIGSSRGGMTMRNYLLHGGSNNVAIAITCGTPNHGVIALDTNLDGEFNGKGHYLQSLNHAYNAGSEVAPGVKTMTLRSDKLDKYAQPTGMANGKQTSTGVTYAGPELVGATNIVLPNLDHRELAFTATAFAEMYKFITGAKPTTTQVTPEASPMLSGLVTGFENGNATNLPLEGVHLRIYAIAPTESTTPVYETVIKSDGKWGPFQASSKMEYEFDLEFQGRHVRFYKAPIPRSTALLNLRFLPVPREPRVRGQQVAAPVVAHGNQLYIDRPQGYLSRDRDPVMIDNKVAAEEPAGLPTNDAFSANVSTPVTQMTTVVLRNETIAARPSSDFATDLPVIDFLW